MRYEKNLSSSLVPLQGEFGQQKASKKQSDAPTGVAAIKKGSVVRERSVVDDLLPAWGKALGFSDCFAKAQRESTLQRWARKGSNFSISTPHASNGLVAGFFGTIIGVGALLPNSNLSFVGPWVLPGSLLVGAASVVQLFVDGGLPKILGKVLAPIEKLWRRGSSATSEVSSKELHPLLLEFDEAPPEEKAFLGALLEKWYARLTPGKAGQEAGGSASHIKLLAPAHVALKRRIAEAQALPEEMRGPAKRTFAVYEAIFALGGPKSFISDRQLPAIRVAVEQLKVGERQAVFPMLGRMLFDRDQSKFPMGDEVRAYLVELLLPGDEGWGAQIETD